MTEVLRALVVDDEADIRFFLDETLQKSGFTVVTAENGDEALDLLRDEFFDLVILDLKLGSRTDGLRVLQAIKWRWPQSIVIILTAYGSLDSARFAIHEGIDGYLLKPIDPEELRRAINDALMRRQRLIKPSDQDSHIFRCGKFTIDNELHQVTIDDVPVDLSPREFKLLAYLLHNSDRVVPPPELVRVAQGYDCENENEARDIIKWYVHRLRRKVEPDPSHPQYVLNVRGVG
ncbi:MAG: response regulator transcription factor, partial [Anaerolineae bacterium]|nr:response regulator transcription factor [Anaerolineae bacterium]